MSEERGRGAFVPEVMVEGFHFGIRRDLGCGLGYTAKREDITGAFNKKDDSSRNVCDDGRDAGHVSSSDYFCLRMRNRLQMTFYGSCRN